MSDDELPTSLLFVSSSPGSGSDKEEEIIITSSMNEPFPYSFSSLLLSEEILMIDSLSVSSLLFLVSSLLSLYSYNEDDVDELSDSLSVRLKDIFRVGFVIAVRVFLQM